MTKVRRQHQKLKQAYRRASGGDRRTAFNRLRGFVTEQLRAEIRKRRRRR